MSTLTLPVLKKGSGCHSAEQPARSGRPTVAVVGSPNVGKTSLFNSLTGMRSRTANFAGTTVDYRVGRVALPAGEGRAERVDVDLIDLPGLYSLEPSTEDERVAVRALRGELGGGAAPDAVLLVLDATNLERSLFLASQVLTLGRPALAAVNLVDAARRGGLTIDGEELARRLNCPVVLVSARTGEGLDRLGAAMSAVLGEPVAATAPACGSCGSGCPFASRYAWAEDTAAAVGGHSLEAPARLTEAVDRVVTHPLVGIAAFFGVMLAVFYLIFAIATYPMDLIEAGFGAAGEAVGSVVPEGDLRSLLVDGVIGGVGGVLVFLPQIVILFFCITLLEDTGYMARAAFVMDRLMRRVGLPGKAFVPMLSAHACAVPAIMSTRIIEDRRDRLTTILVLPLLTCSARLPVYAMVVALLFGDEPGKAALVFTGAYGLGIVAALGVAFVFKRTLLKGETRPLVIELPNYRLPSLKNALLTTWDRSAVFVKRAGTVILLLSLGLWAMATYPKLPADAVPATVAAQMAAEPERAEAILAQAELEHSLAGRLGHLVSPVFEPLGFDWQINVGVLSSFAAREVIVSTLSIVYGMGAGDDVEGLAGTLRERVDASGQPVFGVATCLSLLVFYVLAMQCLPTQAVTKRETGSWKWAAFQLGYMTVLAYTAALVTYQVASLVW